jgi:hypothetical protein
MCIAGLPLALALLVDARVARAQPSLDLIWNVPREDEARCPDRAWMIAAVRRLVTSATPQSLRVSAAVREEDGEWIVDLELSGAASGTRTLRAGTCTSVARGAVLIVALALDPQAKLPSDDLVQPEPPPPAPPPPPPPEPPPEPPRPEPTRDDVRGVEPAHSPAASVRPIVFLGASAGRAILPGVTPGAVAGGGIVWGALRTDLAIELVPGAHAALSRVPAVGADVSLAALALRTCAGHAVSWIAFHGCAAVRGVRVTGEGTGPVQSYRQTAELILLEPGALVRIPGTTRLAAELDAAAVLPITHPDFVILSSGPNARLFAVSPFGARVALAASFRF